MVNVESAAKACLPSICKAIGCSEDVAEWLICNSPVLVDEDGDVVFPEHACHPRGVRYTVKAGYWLRLQYLNVDDGYCIEGQFDYHKNLLSLIEKTGIAVWQFRGESIEG
jgi:hypothetical protein